MRGMGEAGDAMDMIIISPEPGKHKEIGKRLIELADNPYTDIAWVTWPAAGYAVTPELFARFDSDGEEDTDEKEAPKRRRGRQRKESTDNNTSEEE